MNRWNKCLWILENYDTSNSIFAYNYYTNCLNNKILEKVNKF